MFLIKLDTDGETFLVDDGKQSRTHEAKLATIFATRALAMQSIKKARNVQHPTLVPKMAIVEVATRNEVKNYLLSYGWRFSILCDHVIEVTRDNINYYVFLSSRFFYSLSTPSGISAEYMLDGLPLFEIIRTINATSRMGIPLPSIDYDH